MVAVECVVSFSGSVVVVDKVPPRVRYGVATGSSMAGMGIVFGGSETMESVVTVDASATGAVLDDDSVKGSDSRDLDLTRRLGVSSITGVGTTASLDLDLTSRRGDLDGIRAPSAAAAGVGASHGALSRLTFSWLDEASNVEFVESTTGLADSAPPPNEGKAWLRAGLLKRFEMEDRQSLTGVLKLLGAVVDDSNLALACRTPTGLVGDLAS
jgi:hypothetical protein